MTTDVVQDFAAIQSEKRVTAARRYRQIVHDMAAGDVSALDVADELDDALRRLGLTQDDLAGDVATAQEYVRLTDEQAAFERQRPALIEKDRKLREAITAAKLNARRAERLHVEAIQTRKTEGAPWARQERRKKRLAELAGNARLFGPEPAESAS